MGIPSFFKWIIQKYPKLTSEAKESAVYNIDNVLVPVDSTKPNPNGVEYDNLYLDMNGIIHPCTHPEDKPAPKNEDEMYIEIFKYIDRIFDIIRPRKLLYMAVDGVAPRAKMNQQRSRRFRAVQEAQLLIDAQEEVQRKLLETNPNLMGGTAEKKEHFDSNCITPGTPFMARLAIALRYYIADRLNTNPGWANVSVILSDANVPGEGEHKIMDYIRRQRCQPHYSPQTHHVLYGLDADLIMLAIATHEPHFEILREDVMFKDAANKGCFICGQMGHMAAQCTGKTIESTSSEKTILPAKPFVLLHINILREYLEMELSFNDPAVEWNLERALDDWVFLCFFVGNDFLPHLPSLEIREGAIDKLVALWKKHIVLQQGYLTKSGEIDLEKVVNVFKDLGDIEDEIFRERRIGEERRRASRRRRKADHQRQLEQQRAPKVHDSIIYANVPSYPVNITPDERYLLAKESNELRSRSVRAGTDDANKNALAALKQSLKRPAEAMAVPVLLKDPELETAVVHEEEEEEEVIEEESGNVHPLIALNTPTTAIVPKVPAKEIMENDSEEEPDDSVRLWESGWKERYYSEKFNTYADDEAFKRDIVTKYVEGFSWVLKYYYQGVQSWTWYFPYHYSPFASDFLIMGNLDIKLEMGTPFNPFEQLMGVLPSASRQHVPEAFQDLMHLSESPIIDFYPEKFPIDLNGKKFAWQGVAILPFIDENRLQAAMASSYNNLTEAQQEANKRGTELLWVGCHNQAYEPLCEMYAKPDQISSLPHGIILGAASLDSGVCLPASTFHSPMPEYGLPDIQDNATISVVYHMPSYADGFIFESKLAPQVRLPPRVLDAYDFEIVKSGGNLRGRGRGRASDVADRFVRGNLSRDDYSKRGRSDNYNNDRGGNYNDPRGYGGGNRDYNDRNFQSPGSNRGYDHNRDTNYRQPRQSEYYHGNDGGFRNTRGDFHHGGHDALFRGGGGGNNYRGGPNHRGGRDNTRSRGPAGNFSGGYTPRGRGSEQNRGSDQRYNSRR